MSLTPPEVLGDCLPGIVKFSVSWQGQPSSEHSGVGGGLGAGEGLGDGMGDATGAGVGVGVGDGLGPGLGDGDGGEGDRVGEGGMAGS